MWQVTFDDSLRQVDNAVMQRTEKEFWEYRKIFTAISMRRPCSSHIAWATISFSTCSAPRPDRGFRPDHRASAQIDLSGAPSVWNLISPSVTESPSDCRAWGYRKGIYVRPVRNISKTVLSA